MVSENGPNNGAGAPIHSGGAESALDLTNEKDRGALRQALTWWPGRWSKMDQARRDRIVDELFRAVDEVEAIDDPVVRVAARASLVKTAVMIEGQTQKDQHKAIDKLAADKHQHNVSGGVIVIAPPIHSRITE